MKLEHFERYNVDGHFMTDMTEKEFIEWVKEYTFGAVTGDRITVRFLVELSNFTESITFSEDHKTITVEYEDVAEAEEYAADAVEPDYDMRPDCNAAYPDAWGGTTWDQHHRG